MRFHQPLNEILGSAAKVRVLRFFCQKGGEWNGRQAAAQLAMNPVTAHRALRELYGETLLDFRPVGTHFLYSLRDGHYLVRDLLKPLFKEEDRARERVGELIREILKGDLKREVVTVALYGSAAKGQERPTSDLDLLVLVKSDRARRRIEAGLDRFSRMASAEFGNVPAAYVNTVREARRKDFRGMPLFKAIRAQHRVIYGRPLSETLRGQTA